MTVITDADLDEYIQDVGSRIAAVAPAVAPGKANADFLKSVRCHLVNCDTINAFNTGGTHVYIYNGLFQQCQSEEELAAVVAHAYAHLINRDLESTRMRPDPREPLSMAAWQFVINRFTLDQEEKADALAVADLCESGLGPESFPVRVRTSGIAQWRNDRGRSSGDFHRALGIFSRSDRTSNGQVACFRWPIRKPM